MTKRPRGSDSPGPGAAAASPITHNVPSELIAKALAELDGFDSHIASLAARKGAAFTRFEEQGLDREVLKATQKLARGKNREEAMAFIMKLTGYGVAAEVLPPLATDEWTAAVKQADMFAPATGEASEEMRHARARRQGMAAGKKGHDVQSSPYQSRPGSPEYVGWRDGWNEGRELRKLTKPDADKVVAIPSTPRPRGRPRKNQEAAATPETDDAQTAEQIAEGVAEELGSDMPAASEAIN